MAQDKDEEERLAQQRRKQWKQQMYNSHVSHGKWFLPRYTAQNRTLEDEDEGGDFPGVGGIKGVYQLRFRAPSLVEKVTWINCLEVFDHVNYRPDRDSLVAAPMEEDPAVTTPMPAPRPT